MSHDLKPARRQFLGPTSSRKGHTAAQAQCTPFDLPLGGVLVFNSTYTTTLDQKVVFKQPCELNANGTIDPGVTGNATITGPQEPFYASTSPQIYAIATATVISYFLLILVFITPRTFFVGGPGGGANILGRRGVISGGGTSSVVGVGRRPRLQKIATVTVAISLTIATVYTFRVAQHQYEEGFIDSNELVDRVVGSVAIRVTRVISDTFLWLAQVQTLIRLFPRHKEKVTIKWLGFALVSLDTVFSILNDFVDQSTRTRPRSFQDAIPALTYLFELAISLIYASCVIYYSLSKRRFAFWHPKMRNVCLVAFLSLAAVLIPVVFFVLDIAKPDVAGWGDYIRWVGAAAASVVVWEWVERIEALERDERKDGILGREIFDGDEMLDDERSDDVDWPGRREYWNRNGFPEGNVDPGQDSVPLSRLRGLKSRIPHADRLRNRRSKNTDANPMGIITTDLAQPQPTVPPQTVTPVSRSDTTSATSTVYAIHYHNVHNPSPGIPEEPVVQDVHPATAPAVGEIPDSAASSDEPATTKESAEGAWNEKTEEARDSAGVQKASWLAVQNPFKRKRASPPAEVAGAQLTNGALRRSPIDRALGLRSRIGALALSQRGRFSGRSGSNAAAPMAVTVIPAQRRGHQTWSPNDELPEDDDDELAESTRNGNAEHIQSRPLAPPLSSRHAITSLPVTLIPAPKRGDRTWSPDDPRNNHGIDSPRQITSLASARQQPAPRSTQISTSPSHESPGLVFSTRGSLIFSEGLSRGPLPSRRVSGTTRSTQAISPPAPVREESRSATAQTSSANVSQNEQNSVRDGAPSSGEEGHPPPNSPEPGGAVS